MTLIFAFILLIFTPIARYLVQRNRRLRPWLIAAYLLLIGWMVYYLGELLSHS